MAKLKLVASPTFKSKAGIPVAGGAPVDVEFTFKHRTKKELTEFIESRAGKSDPETFLEMVVGWELEDEFNAASVETLCENYIGAAMATFRHYIAELSKHRAGN